MCHCEGACARGNLQCTWLHRTKIEEKFTPEIPTTSLRTGFGMTQFLDCAAYLQNVKFCVIVRVGDDDHIVPCTGVAISRESYEL